MFRKAMLLAAFALALTVQQVYSADVKNTFSGMDVGCQGSYDNRIKPLYDTNPVCREIVFQALNTTVPSECPGGAKAAADKTSETWKCLTGNGNQTIINRWAAWIKECEVLYIANRKDDGEAESDALKTGDNSCFPAFRSYSAFVEYLQYGTTGGSNPAASPGNSSSGLRVAIYTLAACLALALLILA